MSVFGSAHGAWQLTRCAFSHWATDRAATLGAALAFYCAFSLAPLLIILVTLTGWIVGDELATQQLQSQLTALFGAGTASTLMAAMRSSQTGDESRRSRYGGLVIPSAVRHLLSRPSWPTTR